jgi:hypothetical protein
MSEPFEARTGPSDPRFPNADNETQEPLQTSDKIELTAWQRGGCVIERSHILHVARPIALPVNRTCMSMNARCASDFI